MQHIKSLDGVRGIAVILVLIAHTPFIINAELINAGLKIIKQSGAAYIGVEIFFILSGYLITSILMSNIRRGNNVIGNFYIKRVFRLLPVIIVAVSSCALIFPEYEYIYQLLFLSNYYSALNPGPHPLAHFWSLAVEEQFYIFWPLLLLGCKGNIKKINFLFISIALISVVSIILYDFIIASGLTRDLMYRGIEVRMLSLLSGSAIAIYGIPKIKLEVLIAMAVVSLVVVVLSKIGSEYFGFSYAATVNYLGYLVFCTCFFVFSIRVKGFVRDLLESKFLTFFGKISYGLYVYHLPVFFYFGVSHSQEGGSGARLIDIFFIYSTTFSITLASFYFIETPLLKVKDKILAKRSSKEALERDLTQ